MNANPTTIAKPPSTMPAIATPPLLAVPRLARACPMKPKMTARIPKAMGAKTVATLRSPMTASTSEAIPSPFLGEAACGG
jgi:hypothetical protein